MSIIRWGGGGGCEPKSQVDRHCTYGMYMHAIFVVQHSKLRSFQRERRGSEHEMNDVRFRDDGKRLRQLLTLEVIHWFEGKDENRKSLKNIFDCHHQDSNQGTFA